MKKGVGILVSGISILSLAVTSIAVGVSFALYTNDDDVKSDGTSGEISLRSYYESGTGTELDPYIITRPRHLYNLSRLQALGVYDSMTYFKLGKEGLNGDNSGLPVCYLDDSSMTTVPFLDMSDSSYIYEPINAIGSEAVPFYGDFNGQNVEIKNLNVYANPEDAGLFGYTAHGSKVYNLFLSDVTIHALGYTSEFEGLYGESSTASTGTSFTYVLGEDSDTFVSSDTDKVKTKNYDASVIFNWNGQGNIPEVEDEAPVIGFTHESNAYKYKLLISGDFFKDNGDDTVSVDLQAVYKFFKDEKGDATGFPLSASSSVSLIADTIDNNGLEHSKVISSLTVDFSLGSSTTTLLTMYIHLGEEHTNNIGLIIGHCDGSVENCYVHNGSFVMNDGQVITGSNHTNMANGSNYGLIGKIGGTVHNFAAAESDGSTQAGKDIGVLDFSTIYDDIITNTSFTGSQSLNPGVTYTPSNSDTYKEFLRKDGSGRYVTLATDTVSFNRQKVISNADLGVFTVATDQTGTGMNDDAQNGLNKSVIRKEDPSVNSKYYVYYATGEYQKAEATDEMDFEDFRESLIADRPYGFHPGYHFPSADQITVESFDQRDKHQNYIIRFEVDSQYRASKGFYFCDVDKTTVGGSFLSKYFEHTLVDKSGNPILASSESKKSGVMLRDSLGQEIRKLNSSFATPDLSNGTKMYCVTNSDFHNPVANTVNFEVKTDVANVTIVAGLVDNNKPASLGVYRIDNADRGTSDGLEYVDIDYDDPDYAFFMPTDSHLAYFDYQVDNEGKGQIGVYNSSGHFDTATVHTNATVPNTYEANGSNGDNKYSPITEHGYSSGKTRLYAHTFKLPHGTYCLGSATGTNTDSTTFEGNNKKVFGAAKVYYLCAQGQTEGQIEINDNAFASRDEVRNVDFTKVERFTYNENAGTWTENITFGAITEYNPSDSRLENQRCYVSLVNSDRSLFTANPCEVRFVYENNKFKVLSSTTNYITHLAVNNYATRHSNSITGLTNTTVVLFTGSGSTDDPLVYP